MKVILLISLGLLQTVLSRKGSDADFDFDSLCTGDGCVDHGPQVACSAFTDCFNCALAQCEWTGTVCRDDPNRSEPRG